MDWALIIASAAIIVASLALAIATGISFRVHRLEWEIEHLKEEMRVGVSPFPISPEVEDMPAFLKRQAD